MRRNPKSDRNYPVLPYSNDRYAHSIIVGYLVGDSLGLKTKLISSLMFICTRKIVQTIIILILLQGRPYTICFSFCIIFHHRQQVDG